MAVKKIKKMSGDLVIPILFIAFTSTASLIIMARLGTPSIWGWVMGILTMLSWVCYYILNPRRKKKV